MRIGRGPGRRPKLRSFPRKRESRAARHSPGDEGAVLISTGGLGGRLSLQAEKAAKPQWDSGMREYERL